MEGPGKVLINGQQASTSPADPPAHSSGPPTKIGRVYINGHEAVHTGCGGMAIAFPDVCLCPPGPPAGPVPVPLTNTVQAKDMVGGALTVVIQGNPAGNKDSYFATSTGNEISRNTGGGVISHAVQGKAHFGSWSRDVVIEGKGAVRDSDLLTHNHKGRNSANCPPSVWIASVCPGSAPSGPPKKSTKVLDEGTEWIELRAIDPDGNPLPFRRYRVTTPGGAVVDGRTLAGGTVVIKGLKPGKCKVEWLPEDPVALSKG